MKQKSLFLLALLLVPFFAFSQQNLQNQQKDVPVLSPKVIIGDLVFVSQTLKTVEIKGSEVDAFLQVDQAITKILQDLNSQGKKATDSIEIKMPLNIAQNTLAFMDRAVLSGQNAVIYKRFVDAVVESSKKK
jgi:enamine deaminase RidA (YjgF/YER057c/UK114 family)